MGQGCPDNLTGHIYFPRDGHYVVPGSELLEYADGGTQPIGALKPPQGDYAVNCAVDPTTGNVAVVLGEKSRSGVVGIYAPGAHRPKIYQYAGLHWSAWCVYDDAGNLFIEGETNKYKFLLLELPKGAGKLINLSLHAKTITLGFPILWDGSHTTIESLDSETGVLTIFRIAVAGSKAAVVGKTELKGSARAAWIQGGDTAITGRCCKDGSGSYIAFYDYPVGGEPKNIFKGLRNKRGESKPSLDVIYLSVATPPSGSQSLP